MNVLQRPGLSPSATGQRETPIPRSNNNNNNNNNDNNNNNIYNDNDFAPLGAGGSEPGFVGCSGSQEDHLATVAENGLQHYWLRQNFLVVRMRFGSPKEKLLAGPIATLLKQDTSVFPLATIAHPTRKF